MLMVLLLLLVSVVAAGPTASVVAGALAASQSLRRTGCLPTFGSQILMPVLPVGLLFGAGCAVAAFQAHVEKRILKPVREVVVMVVMVVVVVVVFFLVMAPALSFLAAMALVDFAVVGAIVVEELEGMSGM